MKTQKNLIGTLGGNLRPDVYETYADFFLNYIQAYEEKGTSLYALTIQNEPLYAPDNYPGMHMSFEEQTDFIGNYLGPKLLKAGIKTKIVVYDHNYDNIDYAKNVCADQRANDYLSGAGFHHYTSEGAEWNISTFKTSNPTKQIWITEAGFGDWMGDVYSQFQNQMVRLIKTSRFWSKG